MIRLMQRIRAAKENGHNKGYAKAVAIYTKEMRHRERAHAKSMRELERAQEGELKSLSRYRESLQKQLEKRDKLLFFMLDRLNQVEAHEKKVKSAFDRSLKELSRASASSSELDTIRQDVLRAVSEAK